jgi:uncharacterized protein (TIGR03118 family)
LAAVLAISLFGATAIRADDMAAAIGDNLAGVRNDLAQVRNDPAEERNAYTQTNLVSDGAIPAPTTDAKLLNAWGVAFFPGGPFWVADNGSGFSTLYDGIGAKQALEVEIPTPDGAPQGNTATPTGLVFNVTTQFHIPGTNNLPALFIFDTEDGTIAAWNPNLPDRTRAVIVVDNSQNGTGAVYKGLATGSNSQGNFLFATNFRAGTVDVFDSSFAPATLDGSFTDPDLPVGFAPFGIRNIDGDLFVTFALQNDAKHDDVAGLGNGFVDIFDTDGHLIRRFASDRRLNSPWGITRTSFAFGRFSGDILIGNFGDGRINAFDGQGKFLDQLESTDGQPIEIDGLWSLTFGGAAKSDPDTLYFTAGPNGEKDGLFGSLTPVVDRSAVAASAR